MNTSNNSSDWTEMRAKIKARFGKLTDDSVDSLKGNLDQLASKLQSVYGYAKEQADREFASFKASIHAATEPVLKVVTPEPAKVPVEKVP